MLKSYEKFVKDIGLVFVTDSVKILASVLIIPIITKTLGAAGFGIWNQLRITVTLISTFTIIGLHHSFLRHLAGESDKERIAREFWAIILAIFILGCSFASIFFLSGDVLYVYIFGKEQIPHLITMTTVLLAVFPLDYFMTSYFHTFRQMKNHSLLTIAEMVTQVGLLALLIYMDYGIFGAALAFLMTKICFLFLRSSKIILQIGFSVPELKVILPYIRFGFPMVLSGTFFLIVNFADRYIINYFLGIQEVGIYSFVYNIGNLIMTIMTPIMYILYPTLAECWNNRQYDDLRRYIRYSIKYNLFLSIPIAFSLVVLSEEITLTLSSPQFLSGSLLIPLLVMAFLIFGVGVVGEHMMIILGKTKTVFTIYFSLSLLNISMNIILVPMMGIAGAALNTLVSFVLYSSVTLSISWRRIRFHLDYGPIFKTIFASSVASFALWFLKSFILSYFLVSWIIAGTIYLILLYSLGVFEKREIEFFIQLLFRRNVQMERTT